jgi:hypothetical protein
LHLIRARLKYLKNIADKREEERKKREQELRSKRGSSKNKPPKAFRKRK